MPKYKLKIENPSVDGITGHHTVDVHIIETLEDGTEVKGIEERYGVDSLALESAHSGDVNSWLKHVGREMLEKHIRRSKAHIELVNLAGTTIEIEEKP
jgi:hypothetical protein